MPGDNARHRKGAASSGAITAMRGVIKMRMDCRPAFNFARNPHSVEVVERGAALQCPSVAVAGVCAPTSTWRSTVIGVFADFTLTEGTDRVLRTDRTARRRYRPCFSPAKECRGPVPPDADLLAQLDLEKHLQGALAGNRQTLGACPEASDLRPHRRHRRRPHLQPARGPSAASATGTTAIPGSAIRLSPSTPSCALASPKEAERFMHFLQRHCLSEMSNGNGPLQIMYGIDGRRDLTEEELDHLDGYRGSKPVRVGNAAHHQLQLDIYGELMDAVYLYNKYGAPDFLRFLADTAPAASTGSATTGTVPTKGCGRCASGRQHFVYSKADVLGRRRPRHPSVRQALVPVRPQPLAPRAQRDVRGDHVEGLEPRAPVLRAALRFGHPRRRQHDHAPRLLPVADRPAHVEDPARPPCNRPRRAALFPTAWSTATTSAKPRTG